MDELSVLITGGAGFIGTNLVRKLTHKVKNIIVIDNFSRGKKKYIENYSNVQIIEGDLTDYSICLKYIKDVNIVYHFAEIVCSIDYAYNNQSYIYRQNILINSNVLSACLHNHIKNYIYLGTACSYPKEKQLKKELNFFSEEDVYPLSPETSYGMSKYLGEYEAELVLKEKENCINIGILRLHNVYGPYCSYDINPQVIPAMIQKVILNKEGTDINVWGSGKQYRDFIYIDDVVNALELVYFKGMNKGVIQIGSGIPTTISDLCKKLVSLNKQLLRGDIDLFHDITKLEGDFGRLSINTKANNILGWKPTVDINEGLHATFKWMLDVIGNLNVITSNLMSIPTKENLSNPDEGGLTGVNKQGSFRNEYHTGLGNCLFQVASTCALSWDNNYEATFPRIKVFYDILQHKGFKNDNIYRKLKTYDIKIKETRSISQGWHDIKITPNLEICCYFNCYKYFDKYKDRILNLFSIDDKSLAYINNKYSQILTNNITVSIHVRRGDFVTIAKTWNK